MFELDCSVHAEIRSRALRQCFVKRDIHRDRALLHSRIDPRDVAGYHAIASVDHCFLFDLNILRLRFSDFDLRLQLRWVRDAGEIVANLESLADLHR